MSGRYFVIIGFLMLGLLVGCAAGPVPVAVPLNPSLSIETLASSVSVSVKAGEKGMSGRGYLLMRLPERFRLVILSPFGTTVAEIFLKGEELLYLASAQNLAYQGVLADLPNVPALQGWRLLRWTTERVTPESNGQQTLDRQGPDGERETIVFDSRGLVLKKSIDGDEVRYEGYQSVKGVPVPSAIEIVDRAGVTVRITLEEPEVNEPLDENAFTPALEGVKILPLGLFPTS
jgi:hypothetical protein